MNNVRFSLEARYPGLYDSIVETLVEAEAKFNARTGQAPSEFLLEHTLRTVLISHKLCKMEGIDSFLPTLVALFHDAGLGFEHAGVAGLAILDKAGIAGATVGALTARIGDGHSTLMQGMLSEVNEAAYRLGARVGASALALALSVTEKAR